MKQIPLLCCIILLLITRVISAQEVTEIAESDTLSRSAQLALSSPDYLVTAGDIYTLEYVVGGEERVYKIVLDSSYRIRFSSLGIINAASNLGVINAEGKNYPQFKAEIEAIVINHYPQSGVQLVLTEPAAFRVRIIGEVGSSQEIVTWALVRVSSLVGGNLTPYSSIRDIAITSLNGQTRTCDLFKARRFGDLSQNPFVRPGDIITVSRIERVVSVSGAVERAGSYQLLAGENLKDLVAYYASGYVPTADPTRIELVRHVDSVTDSGDKLYLTGEDVDTNYPLNHLDAVHVPLITDLTPVMFVEGAVWASEGAALTTSTRLTVRFNMGENYASLVQRNRGWFSATSDTRNAYLIREEEQIPLNLNPMLYDSSYRSQYNVKEDDILIIPFRQYFVTVAGAVYAPGRYPYIPDREWDYYIALAGGFIPERNVRDTVSIVDLAGKKLSKRDAVTPETIITAATNKGLYYFKEYAPVITTSLSILSALISVTAILSTR